MGFVFDGGFLVDLFLRFKLWHQVPFHYSLPQVHTFCIERRKTVISVTSLLARCLGPFRGDHILMPCLSHRLAGWLVRECAFASTIIFKSGVSRYLSGTYGSTRL